MNYRIKIYAKLNKKAITQVRETRDGLGNIIFHLNREGIDDMDSTLEQILDYHFANSSLEWVSPEEVGALTDAPIFGEVDRDDHGNLTKVHDLWWFPKYETIDPVQELREKGKVFFTHAGDAPEKNELEELSMTSSDYRQKIYAKLNKKAIGFREFGEEYKILKGHRSIIEDKLEEALASGDKEAITLNIRAIEDMERKILDFFKKHGHEYYPPAPIATVAED